MEQTTLTIGRLTLVKSFSISQLNHLSVALPNPKSNALKAINNILFDFVLNSKWDKIKRQVCTQKYEHGGLRMVDIKSYIKGLKSTWMRRLIRDNSKWKTMLENTINIEKILNTGSDYILQMQEFLRNDFGRKLP